MSNNSSYKYKRVSVSAGMGRSWGFRVQPRRFCVQRLRAKLLYLCRLLNRWKFRLLKKARQSSSSSSRSSSVNINMTNTSNPKPQVWQSSSFYSEAIADCLEFIKRTSISLDEVDHHHHLQAHHHH